MKPTADAFFQVSLICTGLLQASSIVDCAGAEMFGQIISCIFHIKADRAIFGTTCDWLTSSRVDKQIKQVENLTLSLGAMFVFTFIWPWMICHLIIGLVHFVVTKYDLLCLFVSHHITLHFNVWCKSAIKFGQGQNCNFETVFSMV